MAKKFESPAGWAPPGAQFQSRALTNRTTAGVLAGLIVTPIGIAFAAKGGADIRSWVIVGAVTDRWTAALEIVGGSLLLLLVAAMAAFSPMGTVAASLVWGLFPGVLHLLFPGDTLRLIGEIPFLDDSMQVALHAWITDGFALISGMMLLGAALAGMLRK
ncbi:hypothetical protein [Nocardia vermiculata]|uniref:Uncharacterized protein n=1 Tax=Nocardia vermiculata TaxID=257274 RepID=A0A846XU22_9NOCA|nr:hypothetical protein [Nocardia vermiculata]NKY49254.1 hypothetical protein [Nocardia vermiculata]